MSMPIIAIVGRPNVGKSTMFNRIVGEKKAIVEDTPGVTRDRNYARVDRFSIPFYLVDTGGYEAKAEDPLHQYVVEQTKVAIDEADVIFCLFDGNCGVQPGDEEIVRLLRGYKKEVRYIVNKCDGVEHVLKVVDFYAFGVDELLDVSALHGRGISSLVESTLEEIPLYEELKAQISDEKKRKEKEQEEAELEIERQLAALGPVSDDEEDDEVEEEVEFVEEEEEPSFAPVFLPSELEEDEQSYVREYRLAPIKKEIIHKGDTEGEYDEDEEEASPEVSCIKVAIVGRPNVGKSTLFNTLTGTERSITSPISGTTRDSVDTPLKRDGQDYLLIDTAGLRKKARITDKIERYSTLRALRSLAGADVAVVVIDAEQGPTEQDTKVAGLAHEQGLGIIVCVNKWDLVEKNHKTVKEYTKDVQEAFKFARYAPIIFTCALSGRRCPRILDTVKDVAMQRLRRIPTGQLNRVLNSAHKRATAPSYRGRLLKFFFATQIASAPPKFALFFNFARGVHFSYLRCLKNSIRDQFGFVGTDIKLVVRKR